MIRTKEADFSPVIMTVASSGKESIEYPCCFQGQSGFTGFPERMVE